MEKKITDKFKLAFVTGATSGIGAALCQLIADKGINLMISGRNKEKLDSLEKTLSKKVIVRTVHADLLKLSDRQNLVDNIKIHTPDLVINNAGIGLYGEALSYTTEQQLEILQVNGNAVLELTLESARMMISNNIKGTVLNVSSAAGFLVFPNFTIYAASKGLVNQFSEALDFEMKPYGVRILSACPGVVKTHFRERAGGGEEKREGMTSDYAAEQIWQQILCSKPIRIFNWKYRLAILMTYFVPKRWLLGILRDNIEKLHSPRTIIKS